MKNSSMITPDFLKGTFEEYKIYTRHYAKSFYFSSFALPKEKRNASYAVYAFCRFADNITDTNGYESVSYLEEKIHHLRLTLDEVYKQVESESELVSDFTHTIKKYEIPKEYFDDLIDGVASDILKKKYSTFAELDVYCYKVASVVGLIMTKIFGYNNEDALKHAVDLGKAMQLTNILRDISDDFAMGRIYIPEDEIRLFGYSGDAIKTKRIDSNFRNLMEFQINRARNYYKSAETGVSMLTNDGSRSAVKMMSRIYSGILDEIEKDGYDIYSKRHYVSTLRKIRMTAALYISKIFSSMTSHNKDASAEPILD